MVNIYAIPKKILPDGIIVFKLFENSKQPVADRLYFNERKDARVLVNANLEKLKYEQREKIELDIKTAGFDSVPVITHTSILGIELLDSNSQLNATDNILFYFLMSSDLKGVIENPGYYFESEHRDDIDYLMLTQGWINYKYTKPLRNLDFKLEKNLSVSGVINKKRRAKKDQLDLMLMTLDESRNTYTKSIKVPSSFNFDLEDIYGVEQEIIIQGAENWYKEQKNYAIGVQRKKPLLVNFIYDDTHMIKDSLVTRIVNKNKAQKSEEDIAYFNTYGRTELDEVFLSGYNMTPKRKEVFERYGEPETVIDREELMEKERKFHSSGLYSILLDFFKDKITIDQGETGLLSARVLGLPTLVILDGLPVRPIFFRSYKIW